MQHTQTCEVVGGKVKPLEVREGTKETDVFQSMSLGGEGGGGRGERRDGEREGWREGGKERGRDGEGEEWRW